LGQAPLVVNSDQSLVYLFVNSRIIYSNTTYIK